MISSSTTPTMIIATRTMTTGLIINLSTFPPHVWRHQFGYGMRRKAARGYPRRSLHLVRGGGCDERQRRSIARTNRAEWHRSCRTPRNARQCAVLRFDGLFCIPCASIRYATGSPVYGLSLASGSVFRVCVANETHVCGSVGKMCPSRACRIWGTSS